MRNHFNFLAALCLAFLAASCGGDSNSNNNSLSASSIRSCSTMKSLSIPISIKNQSIPKTIVGGTAVTNMNTTLTGNSTVGLVIGNSACTGVIVASNLILTAAHCFDGISPSNSSPGTVIFGDTLINYDSSNSVPILSWQVIPSHNVCPEGPAPIKVVLNCAINDIAWVKIEGSINRFPNYTIVPILANPQSSLSPTESKWYVGFGQLNDNVNNTSGDKYMVQSLSSVAHPDALPPNASNSFDSYTFPNAYELYLTVIGPNNLTIPGVGTCHGDSGGPVFVLRGSNYVLAALTQGTDGLLTPHPTSNSGQPYTFAPSSVATCADGYGVFTTVANYTSWIISSSGVNITLCQ